MNEQTQNPGISLDVSFRSVPPQGNLLGFADVTFNGAFVVRGFKLLSGVDGLFVGMPAIKEKENYRDVCHPITADMREQLMIAISDAYKNDIERMKEILGVIDGHDEIYHEYDEEDI